MAIDWYLIQFVSDLRRRESKNIGVVTHKNGEWGLRMIGLRRDGVVNGRALRSVGNLKTEVYQQWVKYIQNSIKNDDWHNTLQLHTRRPSNFLILSGGTIFEEASLNKATNQLFEDLVTVVKLDSRSRENKLEQAIDHIFSKANILVEKDVSVDVEWKALNEQNTLFDSVRFEYSAHESSTAYFDKMPLTGRITANMEMRSRDFYSRAEAAHRIDKKLHFGVFYSSSMAEGLSQSDLDALLRPIEAVGLAVDVDDIDSAVGQTHRLTSA